MSAWRVDPASGVPTATRPAGVRPPQIFTRWYGFSRSFPGCEIYIKDEP